MDIYEELKELSEEISSLYRNLYSLERNNEDKNGSLFSGLVRHLKVRIDKEKKLLNDLVLSEEYDEIREEIFSYQGDDDFYIRIKDLLLLYESSSIQILDEDSDDVVLEKRKFINTGKIFATSAKNVFLVYSYFLQTTIDKLIVRDVKDRLLGLKYYNCMIKPDIGNAMINFNFSAPDFVYTDLNLVIDMMNINEEFGENTVLESYIILINNVIEQLMSKDDKDYLDNVALFAFRLHLLCMLKACFAIMSNREYEEIKDQIISRMNELYNDNNIGSVDNIVDIMNNRKEYQSKIRKLSLKPIK